jgi:4'-phosphopantetheinyl transferase
MMSASSCPPPGEIRAWHAPIDVLHAEPGRLDRALAWIGEPARARFTRYRHRDDAEMFLLGRVMARAAVGRAAGLDPAAWRWRDGVRGRPEVDEPGVALHFSLAHSAGLVVCGLAGDREVGVDVEDRARRPLDRRLVHRYCSASESADIDAQEEDGWHDRFLTYWTLKEAYLKARGLGIAVPLSDVSLSLGDGSATLRFGASLAGLDARWAFATMAPTPRHIVAVAAPSADGPVRFAVEPFPAAWLP